MSKRDLAVSRVCRVVNALVQQDIAGHFVDAKASRMKRSLCDLVQTRGQHDGPFVENFDQRVNVENVLLRRRGFAVEFTPDFYVVDAGQRREHAVIALNGEGIFAHPFD